MLCHGQIKDKKGKEKGAGVPLILGKENTNLLKEGCFVLRFNLVEGIYREMSSIASVESTVRVNEDISCW